ncbi:MAG TPA: FecR domain-containing protein, partial [Acidimicrobiales bacterium]|nr:FecR domain-containing protein [Acidimicrobiales bacterium]
MDDQPTRLPVPDVDGAASGVREGEELAPQPGTVGELVHFDGSITRIDGGGRCVLGQVAARDDTPYIVVRLLEGRIWNHAVPAAGGPSRYELRVSGVVVAARDATFTAVRRADGSCLISVLDGQADVRAGAGSLPVPVGPFQTVTVSRHGDLGLVRTLTPDEVLRDSWLEANRAFD